MAVSRRNLARHRRGKRIFGEIDMKAILPGALLVLLLSLAPLQARAEMDLPAHVKPELVMPLISRLEAEGYAITEIKRTWLGRILILSSNGEYLRETVLNRRSGEILRDRLFNLPEGSSASGADSGVPQNLQDMNRILDDALDGIRKEPGSPGNNLMKRGKSIMGSGSGG